MFCSCRESGELLSKFAGNREQLLFPARWFGRSCFKQNRGCIESIQGVYRSRTARFAFRGTEALAICSLFSGNFTRPWQII